MIRIAPAVPALLALLALLLAGPTAAAQSRDAAAERGLAGARALQEGRVYEAVVLLQQAVAARPDDLDLRLLLGQASLAANLWVPAKQQFEAILDRQPGHGLAAFMLGFALHQAGRHHEAAEALARAESLAPDNPHPKTYRGLALLRLGRPAEAQRELEAALALAPGDPTALTGLAELKLAQGTPEEAEAILRKVLTGAPGVDAKLLLGRALLASGRSGDAVAQLRRLAEEAPNRSDVLYLLAQALLRDGQQAEGRKALDRFAGQKTREERIRLLEVDVSTGPGDRAARLELARLLLDNGQPEAAALHLAPLVRDAPNDPRVAALAAAIDRAR
jgi:Flp pilus assembly protein TadD